LAEKTAEHICFLADVNLLYENALGIYDLDVALLIAQQSQKDPREYLPYLQSLQEMSKLRRQFQIDNDLRRYSKALGHLHDLEEFEELQKYVEKHELYSVAIEMLKYREDKLRKLMQSYANYLAAKSRYKEAGIGTLTYLYGDPELIKGSIRIPWGLCLCWVGLPDSKSLARGIIVSRFIWYARS
jgi:elongator complex protein 1